MPPKPKTQPVTDAETTALISLFESIGLTQTKASDAAKSPKIADPLKSLIEKNQLAGKPLEEKQAGLLVSFAPLAGRLKGDEERDYVTGRIVDGSLRSVDQVTGVSRLFIVSAAN
jgi:glutaminyl-tRNA synthetase